MTTLLLPVVLAASACTGPDGPTAQDAADDLAAGLASGDLGGVVLVTDTGADPQTHLTEVTEPLRAAAERAGRAPTVAVSQVTVDEDAEPRTAEVSLAWSWPLTAQDAWEYSTTTSLEQVEPPDGSDAGPSWEVRWEPELVAPDLRAGERLDVDTVAPDRGDVLDVHDEPLVTERDVWRIGIDKTFGTADTWDAQARRLAMVVGLDLDDYAARVEAAGDKAFVEAITIRQKNPGVNFTAEDARSLDGVNVVADTLELAPTSTFAREVLGRSGPATAEIIEASDGAVATGDVVGLSGLQAAYDEALRGAPGLVVQRVPSEQDADAGEEPTELFRVEPVDGADIATSFDPELQERAEKVLADVEPASAIVAIRPSTGDVLAAASGPGSEGWSTATLGQYAPGSTFKVVDALALLRSGTTPQDTVQCPETLTVDGRTYENVPGYPSSATGKVPLATAFAHSCNTAFIGAMADVDPQDVASAAADLGLVPGPDTGVASFGGDVPTDLDGKTARAEAAIGQGTVLASPLGMATVAASVAAGERVEPRLVREVVGGAPDAAAAPSASPSGSPSASAEAEAEDTTPQGTPAGLTAKEAATLLDLMSGVVSEGSASALADVPGVVGAKTGTAQYGDGSRQHVWMLAVADDLAVAVFVEDGEYGSTTAGPLMGRFLAGS
ncbi:penicillin-binding transpeptidase domain-containing protein [Isoptericola jiangsuensis]|uniref:penicillin-binding transpeptidase domain-containing protein n=1 Tax=Isoptericola jiangsuensis TaxID=548579 RepID=UPI000BF90D38|nr:penicillin-binding transpeptidase domain-containing protein [Isoptericola jiangsuensis]